MIGAASAGETAGIFILSVMLAIALTTWLGWMAGKSRHRAAAGAICGFLLGPLGVVLALFLPAGPEPARSQRRRPQRRAQRPRRRVGVKPRRVR